MKEFWKSVKNWQNYRHEFGVLFWVTVYCEYAKQHNTSTRNTSADGFKGGPGWPWWPEVQGGGPGSYVSRGTWIPFLTSGNFSCPIRKPISELACSFCHTGTHLSASNVMLIGQAQSFNVWLFKLRKHYEGGGIPFPFFVAFGVSISVRRFSTPSLHSWFGRHFVNPGSARDW